MKPFCLTKQHFTNYLPQYICQTKSTYGSTKHENKNKLLKNYCKAPTKSQSDLNKDIFFSSSFLNQKNHIIIFNVAKMNSNTLSQEKRKTFVHTFVTLKYFTNTIILNTVGLIITLPTLFPFRFYALYCVFLLYELS